MTTITTIGRITKDFELKQGEKSGCIYANFSLAVNEGVGENQKTMFFDCVVFGADAERLIKAKAKKGSLIQVTGKFGTSAYISNGGKPSYSLKITVLAWSYIPGTGGQKDANDSGGGNGANGAECSEIGNDDNVQIPGNSPEVDCTEADCHGMMNLDDEDFLP